MVIQHTSEEGIWPHKFSQLVDFYNEIILAPQLVTILRDPVLHYISYYFYYVGREPDANLDWVEWYASKGNLPNLLCAEFGLVTEADVRMFLARDFDQFALVLIADRIDEGLVIMRRKFNWSLLDITYMRLLDSNNSKGYDGQVLRRTPKRHELSPSLLRTIESVTELDRLLVEHASRRLDEEILAYGPEFARDLQIFQTAQTLLREACTLRPSGEARVRYGSESQRLAEGERFCAWYRMEDMEYEATIDDGDSRPKAYLCRGI
eukprot:m.211933 g.211933  ORF g.211933 m.211933 type:complete len:264 (-) comp53985_c0_seq1:24-815(-)